MPSLKLSAGILNAQEAAKLIGKSAAWFRMHRSELEKQGFPLRDALLGGWSKPAIQAWLDTRLHHGIQEAAQ